MSIESGAGVLDFSNEVLSKEFVLLKRFNTERVLGEKKDDEEKNKANEKVREILKTSFHVEGVVETQTNPVLNYESIVQMIEISKNANLNRVVRNNARNTLYEVGLALSLDRDVYKASTEGEETLNQIIPSRLHGIQPYILSSYLTTGKDDEDGHKLVEKLVEVFKLKKRDTLYPGRFQKDFEEKANGLFVELLDRIDDASLEDETKGNVHKWETMVGYIVGVDDKTGREPVLTERVVVKTAGSLERDKINVSGEESEDEKLPERYEAQPPEPPSSGEEDGGVKRKERGGFSYGPEFDEFGDAVIEGRDTDLRINSPATWLKEKKGDDKEWYIIVARLAESSGNKTALKDGLKGVEKLWLDDNIRLKLNQSELKLLYERPGFRLAVEKIIRDLCVLEKDGGVGSDFLYLNRDFGSSGKLKVIELLSDLKKYKNDLVWEVCKQKAYSGRVDYDDLFEGEISAMVSGGKTREKALEVWQNKYKFKEARIEVGTAWNFLYNCDFIESADFSREVGPLVGVKGDAINFIFHPDAKVSSKLTDKKLAIGHDEIKGGPLADWYDYQLTRDPNFRTEYERVDGDRRLFPRRLGVGFLDTYKVVKVGDKDPKKVISMAQALVNGENIDFNEMEASNIDIFKDYKDMREGSLVTFKYLTGQTPIGKSTPNWSVDAQNALSLLRQQGTMPDGKILPVLDDKRLYAAIIYASAGVNKTDKLLSLQYPTSDYKETVRQFCLSSFIRSTNPNLNKKQVLSQFTTFQKEVHDFVYKGSFARGVNNMFR